eukprot:snap_masked-scaffold_5-processed-gene-19.41-mRNA-1 protein AED:1.00 eAED:1.00 QI:0/0/0/0/1/1/2/0/304
MRPPKKKKSVTKQDRSVPSILASDSMFKLIFKTSVAERRDSYKSDIGSVPPNVSKLSHTNNKPKSSRSTKKKSSFLMEQGLQHSSSSKTSSSKNFSRRLSGEDGKFPAFPPANSQGALYIKRNNDSFNTNFNESGTDKIRISRDRLSASQMQMAAKNTKNYYVFKKLGLPLPSTPRNDVEEEESNYTEDKKTNFRKYGAGAIGYFFFLKEIEEFLFSEDIIENRIEDLCSDIEFSNATEALIVNRGLELALCTSQSTFATCTIEGTIKDIQLECAPDLLCKCRTFETFIADNPCGVLKEDCEYI